jgi:hypothetical protein
LAVALIPRLTKYAEKIKYFHMYNIFDISSKTTVTQFDLPATKHCPVSI